MVWRIIFSLALVYGGSCNGDFYDIANYSSYVGLAYQGMAIILLLFILYHVYLYFTNKQDQERIKGAAWNYVMGFFILMALPGYAVFMCEMFKFFFQDITSTSDYMVYSMDMLNKILLDIETTIYLTYDRAVEYSAKSAKPFITPSLSVQYVGCVIGLAFLAFSDIEIRAVPFATNFCVQINQLSYFPERQYSAYIQLLESLRSGYIFLYSGFLLHRLILDIISQGWFAILVPIGVVARFIPGLKKPGDVLIALGFGMQIIYPFVYAMFISTLDYINTGQDQVFIPNDNRPPYDSDKVNLYKYSEYTLLAITLPNLAAAVVAVFVSNAYKTLDLLEI